MRIWGKMSDKFQNPFLTPPVAKPQSDANAQSPDVAPQTQTPQMPAGQVQQPAPQMQTPQMPAPSMPTPQAAAGANPFTSAPTAMPAPAPAPAQAPAQTPIQTAGQSPFAAQPQTPRAPQAVRETASPYQRDVKKPSPFDFANQGAGVVRAQHKQIALGNACATSRLISQVVLVNITALLS